MNLLSKKKISRIGVNLKKEKKKHQWPRDDNSTWFNDYDNFYCKIRNIPALNAIPYSEPGRESLD